MAGPRTPQTTHCRKERAACGALDSPAIAGILKLQKSADFTVGLNPSTNTCVETRLISFALFINIHITTLSWCARAPKRPRGADLRCGIGFGRAPNSLLIRLSVREGAILRAAIARESGMEAKDDHGRLPSGPALGLRAEPHIERRLGHQLPSLKRPSRRTRRRGGSGASSPSLPPKCRPPSFLHRRCVVGCAGDLRGGPCATIPCLHQQLGVEAVGKK